MKSIQQRVVNITSVWVMFCLAVVFLVGYFSIQSFLVKRFDSILINNFLTVAAQTQVWPAGQVWVNLDRELLKFYSKKGGKHYEVNTADGLKHLDRSPYLESHNMHVTHSVNAIVEKPILFDSTLSDGSEVRAAVQTLPAKWGWQTIDPNLEVSEQIKNYHVELVVAQDRSELNKNLQSLALWLFTILMLIPILVSTAVSLGFKSCLNSLTLLRDKFSIVNNPEQQELFGQRCPAEIKPIIITLSQQLNQLQQNLEQERRFTCRAAHELKNPLSELQLVTDVALRGQSDPDRWYKGLNHANVLAVRMGRLITALSQLACHQNRIQQLNYEICNLVSMIEDLLVAEEGNKNERKLTIVKHLPNAYFFYTDIAIIHSILCNLIKNAIAYAPIETTINIELLLNGNSSRCAALKISNIAPQLQCTEINNLFEPFWRKDCEKTSTAIDSHFGLGLAIAKEAAQLLSLELMVNKPDDETIEFSLCLGESRY